MKHQTHFYITELPDLKEGATYRCLCGESVANAVTLCRMAEDDLLDIPATRTMATCMKCLKAVLEYAFSNPDLRVLVYGISNGQEMRHRSSGEDAA